MIILYKNILVNKLLIITWLDDQHAFSVFSAFTLKDYDDGIGIIFPIDHTKY